MLRTLLISFVFVACTSATEQHSSSIQSTNMQDSIKDSSFSIHSFKVDALDGNTIDFSAFKGKKILIVNTASECGYTPQYKDLQKLYETYKDRLVIVGFPANNFGAQEPGSNATIQTFCSKNYGVTFPMAAKISVKGTDMAPIYQFLTQKKLNGVLDTEISWNFNKFLLDENGKIMQKFESAVNPMSEEITSLL
jgi:glutathione peroxidase